ncbi:MAG: hypothetical protein DI533_04550 [Cereibacter sphaeroides]|uniref:Helix-turn-helix domain-containing protein n=1 Tax=Cereibacter sphaeroides TaxID=1063 RepID=A0A2W5SDB2_CERSP|nr:MAG: hypothetical protein DI533_04550 [Cereibacter sphaeroides]
MNAPRFSQTFITTDQVAELLEISPALFLRQREKLAEETGFPDPMPHSTRPLRFRADRVLAWIEEQGLPRPLAAQLPPRPSGKNIFLLEEARKA